MAPSFDGAEPLARKLATTTLVAQILFNRGASDVKSAKAFINPKLTDLHDPTLMAGAQKAAKRIAKAVEAKEKIVIYGDYDVDGMTAVAILFACLKMVGAQVDYYVPHRLEEGYGVNEKAIQQLIDDGAKLMITVDCGISAEKQLGQATSAGLDVIVTDHHKLPEILPDVTAIVHPTLPAEDGKVYPNTNLAGAGVAFKLAWQVAREICGESRVDETMRDFLLDATCMAALGTIADVVPLVGENRVLATFGLRGLSSTKHVGLRALLKSAKLEDEKLDAFHVGFVLGPRLNACGRMGHARSAVELLTEAPPARAAKIADFLTKQNTERQKTDREIAAQAIEMVKEQKLDSPENHMIVLASENWHSGVVGIVASRIVRRFDRPAILIAFNGDGIGQGSGRSIAGFNMRDALAACSQHLISFGGHEMAGGLRIHPDKIKDFTKTITKYASENIQAQQLTATVEIDAETTIQALNYNAVAQLARLEPFGQGNPRPVVALRGCKLIMPPKRLGRNGKTLSMMLEQNGATMRAIGFDMGDLADDLVGVNQIDVAAEPVINRFNGRSNAELKLIDVKSLS